jgi:hypothetical protein
MVTGTFLNVRKATKMTTEFYDDLLDDYGYPTEYALELIMTWPTDDFQGMMEFVASIWYYPDHIEPVEEDQWRCTTGGWSGNEEIIAAMQANQIWWMLNWYSSQRGGHYVFSPVPGYSTDDTK